MDSHSDMLADAAERPDRTGLVAGLLLVLLSALVWLPAVRGAGYAFDDREGVLENPVINGTRPATDAFGRDYWEHRGSAGHYRPIAQLTLALDHRIARGLGPVEEHAAVFRLSSWAWHALVVGFAALLAGRWLTGWSRWSAFGLLWLFAVHPVQADAVAWISGRSSSLGLLPGVVAAWWLARGEASRARAFGCALVATCLGLLAKEDGYVSGLLVVVVAAFPRGAAKPQVVPRAWLGCLAGLGLGLALRHHAIGQWLPAAPHAPLADQALLERLAIGASVLGHALHDVVWPLQLAPIHRAEVFDSNAASIVVGCLAWVVLLAAAWRLRRRRAGWLLAVIVAAWLPFTQAIPAGELFAPRFLYGPLLLLAFALASLRAFGEPRAVVALGLVLVGCLVLPSTQRAAATYADGRAFERAVLAVYPHDARAWNGIGAAHQAAGEVAAARAAWQRAVELDPTYGRPHSGLGALALEAGDVDQAGWHFARAAELGPGNPIAFANLGAFALRERDPERARNAYARALQLAPGLASAWRGLGRAALMTDDLASARTAIARCLELTPNDALARDYWLCATGAAPNRFALPGFDDLDISLEELEALRGALASPDARDALRNLFGAPPEPRER